MRSDSAGPLHNRSGTVTPKSPRAPTVPLRSCLCWSRADTLRLRHICWFSARICECTKNFGIPAVEPLEHPKPIRRPRPAELASELHRWVKQE